MNRTCWTTLAAGAAALLLAAPGATPASATPLRVEKGGSMLGFERESIPDHAMPRLQPGHGSAFSAFHGKRGHRHEGGGGPIRGGSGGGGGGPVGPGPSVPEPSAALLFGVGALVTRAAAHRRSAAR